mgnify:CR=1 FL=1
MPFESLSERLQMSLRRLTGRGKVNENDIDEIMKEVNDIVVLFNAKTNKDTIVNLTNHVYFNLSGNGVRNCLHHNIKFNCDKYTRLNNELITVSIDDVNDVFDFRIPHEIGKYIYDESIQNHKALGYDHCWFKENKDDEKVSLCIQFVVTMDGGIGICPVGKVTRCYGRRLLAFATSIGV